MTGTTSSRDPDAVMTAWLDEGPRDLPDATRRAILTALPTTRQDRGPLSRGRSVLRSRPASGIVALGATALIVIFLGAVLLGRPSSSVGSPSPSGSAGATQLEPTVQPRPSAQPMEIDASGFSVPFTMTWPSTVQLPTIKPDLVEVHARSSVGFNLFLIGRVGLDPCLTDGQTASAITTPQAFMDWLGSISHATAGTVTTSMVDGLPALQRELDIDGDLSGCMDIAELHSNIRLAGAGPGGFYLAAGVHMRWVAFTAKGRLLAFTIWPLTSQPYVTEADQAISTIHFSP
jgi:hypothetical protein